MNSTKIGSAENGATAVEYALLVALVAAIIFGAVLALGTYLPGMYTVPW